MKKQFASRWAYYRRICPIERRWRFITKTGRFYTLLFDKGLFLPPGVDVSGCCSTTHIPEEFGEIKILHRNFQGRSAEHFYFSETRLEKVWCYDGYQPTWFERKLGAVSLTIKNERWLSVDSAENSEWIDYLERFHDVWSAVQNKWG